STKNFQKPNKTKVGSLIIKYNKKKRELKQKNQYDIDIDTKSNTWKIVVEVLIKNSTIQILTKFIYLLKF
ncbi:MAG TPA: hypothetical protein DCE09_01910, partial [Thermoanaerobacter sp.]|nr:hypothetical protein [Thermoanaerobacter sp.]HCD08971.1 hypothetical protein [Thermoanaerobacter sp.]